MSVHLNIVHPTITMLINTQPPGGLFAILSNGGIPFYTQSITSAA
ncbi:hypothetical protein HLRTI_001369, partial [Halorhabdus tiamatea SARL4B]